jgi:hypothetical protein
MNTVTQIRKTRSPSATTAAAVAPAPGTIPQILDDLELAKGLLATGHAAAGTEDINPEDLQTTLGYALERLNAGMYRVRSMRTTED